ncbi:hypothetical protein SUGI_0431000 [Cryptomeria japonica]|nr:hypothetical protein SUGI_0431000 [Cryptomeria japonica]
MGIALSSSSSSPKTRPTAKLILDDGALREYEHPVKVAQVLNERGREAFFICLSDSINFNEWVDVSMGGDSYRAAGVEGGAVVAGGGRSCERQGLGVPAKSQRGRGEGQ